MFPVFICDNLSKLCGIWATNECLIALNFRMILKIDLMPKSIVNHAISSLPNHILYVEEKHVQAV